MNMRMLAFSVLCAISCLAKNYTISGPSAPKASEATALKELGDYLDKRIDGTLEIGGSKTVTFHVGDTALAKEHKCLSSELQDEQWVVKSVGGDVIINGGGSRGVLYGVYHFLEDCCDVHWWSDIEEYVPKASSLTLPALDMVGKPAFLYRDIYRTNRMDNSPRTAVRNRLNRNGDQEITAELGGSFTYGEPYHCHTFCRYIPEEKYMKDHPEYFALVKGKRIGGFETGQLCVCNDDVRSELLKNLLENIRKDKEKAEKAGLPAPRLYDVSMNDNTKHCECEKCMAAAEKYNHSGAYLIFLNWIADEVAKVYPDVYLTTLAYFYTEPPPKGGIRAAKNLIIKLCDTKSNMAVSILDPSNTVFREFVEAWKIAADNLFIWDYSITYGKGRPEMPLASEFTYGDTYKFYLQNNVTGVFWEHEYPAYADMYELKYFLECKLFEDPYQDADKLIELFMDRYYGAAAKYILEYRKLIDQARKDNNGNVKWFPQFVDFEFITDEVCHTALEILDKAEEAVAGDNLLFRRVRHARAGLDKLILETRSSFDIFYDHGVSKKQSRFDGAPSLKRLNETYVDWFRQYESLPELVAFGEEVLKNFNSKEVVKVAPIPEQFKNEQCYDWYPTKFTPQGKNTYLCDDPESACGKAMRMNADKDNNYRLPFACGFHDRKIVKNLCSSSYKTLPEGKGYHWYKVGTFKNPTNGYIYVTRSWTTQINTGVSHLIGKDLEAWVHVKHTGPLFYPDETGDSYIYVDRCILVVK